MRNLTAIASGTQLKILYKCVKCIQYPSLKSTRNTRSKSCDQSTPPDHNAKFKNLATAKRPQR